MRVHTETSIFNAPPQLVEGAKAMAQEDGMTYSEFIRLALREKVKRSREGNNN